MENLLGLGKNLVKEMKNQYEDCFYRYVDENSFDDETYISIGKGLFDNKEKFIDYMNHLYIEDFNWLNSEVNSFDFIQDLVDKKIKESKKYRLCDSEEAFVPVIEYSDSLRDNYKDIFSTPCYIRNSIIEKEFYVQGYDEFNEGYRLFDEYNEEWLFLQDRVNNIYDYISSKLSTPTVEINGLLNLYLELNNSVWNAKEDDIEIENRASKEKRNVVEVLGECLEELIESNPDILKKYGLNQIISNIHEARVQEV